MSFENLVEDGRVRRSRETRARLIEATWALLGEGNWRPTAREIARRTGVSQRTVFAHFGTLNDLMTEAAARHTDDAAGMMRRLTPAAPVRL
jgi:AcrR family transcriptional regulator